MKRRSSLIFYLFEPLVSKGRWILWIFGMLIFLVLFGNILAAIKMNIPSEGQVVKITGIFSDASSKKYSKGQFYSVDIIDDYGVMHKCICDSLPNSNCLDGRTKAQQEILGLLDDRILEEYGTHKAIVTWLNGNRGQVWMYPEAGLFGAKNICYQISDMSRTYISYEPLSWSISHMPDKAFHPK